MNRIKELRTAKGWSREELAAAVNTTATQIGRLETGTRRLTEDWMRLLASALGVQPADLLVSAALATIRDEIEPARPNGMSNVARALSARSMKLYRVLENSLEDAGILAGQVFLADETSEAARNAKTGDIVVCRLKKRGTSDAGGLAIRMFVAPDMLVTNRSGNNIAIKLNDLSIDAQVVGVVIPGSVEDEAHTGA